jgi:hypothetical protein
MAAVMQLVCSVATVEAIVRLAQRVPVFPCRRTPEELTVRGKPKLYGPKTPLTPNGLHDATQDPERIRAWWRQWPDALVGVPTGSVTGLFVLDYDAHKVDEASREWVAGNTDLLLTTRAHETLNGGRHYLYRITPGALYRSGTNVLLGNQKRVGIDVRAEGGYIIWWPMHGAQASGELALLPAGLADQLRIEKRELPALPTATPQAWEKDRPRLIDALAYCDPADYGAWFRTGMAIHLASGGSEEGFALWHDWSAGGITGDVPVSYSGREDCRYHWDTFLHDKDRRGTVTIASVFHAAKAGGWQRAAVLPEPPPMEFAPVEAYEDEARGYDDSPPPASTGETASTGPVRAPINWLDLSGKTPPEREWAVEHWLPMGHTALCSGKGGLGKTLMMQTMATCIATGREYVDQVFRPRRVLFWAGEDEADELWRRQIKICDWLGIPLTDLAGKFILESYFARDITLAGLAHGSLVQTSMLAELEQQIGDYRADYVILDSTARVFGGSENDRHQVTTFISWLANACKPTGAGLCLIGHPGKADGSEYSGSTAWEGSVRSRLYLSTKLPDQEADQDGDSAAVDDCRYLSRRKANYAAQDYRKLLYSDGVLMPENTQAQRPRRAMSPEFAQEAVLTAVRTLKGMNMFGTTSTSSPLYLPRMAKQYGLLEGMSASQFGAQMRELLKAGRLTQAAVGMYANRTPRMGLIEA